MRTSSNHHRAIRRTPAPSGLGFGFAFALLLATAAPILSQGNPLGGMGSSVRFDGPLGKLFGDHKAFACEMEIEATPSKERPDTITMPARLFFSDGKIRYEMDLTRMKGGMVPAGMMEQFKAFGMAEMAIVSQPTKPAMIVYPNLKSYAPVAQNETNSSPEDFKMESQEIGKDDIQGEVCSKNKVTVTGKDGKKFEATVWQSPRLKKFPVRVQSNEGGTPFTLTFRDIKLEKPAASLFEMPAAYTKYEDANTLVRSVMMKKLQEGGAPGAPK